MRELGLIGRIGGEEFATLHERIDHDRAVMGVGAGAEETGVAVAVFLGALLEPVHDFGLGHLARDGQIAVETILRWNRREKIVDGTDPDRLEHGVAVGGRFG